MDAALRADIDRHLETCEICSAVLDSTRNVVVLVADDRVFELPAGSASGCTRASDKELEAAERLRFLRVNAITELILQRRRRSRAVNDG